VIQKNADIRLKAPSVQRSRLMGRVRRTGTAPEIQLRKALHRQGRRFRLGSYGLPGSPDLVFRSARVAIFVDGCFWHGCELHGTMPKTNAHFWRQKIRRNKQRDRRVNIELKRGGWNVVRVWEHQIRDNLPSAVSRIKKLVVRG
jgi:DNA mismatch endonuclease (patch repair protein)